MAEQLASNAGDVVVLLKDYEYNALISLLHEVRDPKKLTKITEDHRLDVTSQQVRRISDMWSQLTQRRPR